MSECTAAADRHVQSEQEESIWSLAAFWIVAFIGAALFAAVLIAPKWEERQRLAARVRYHAAVCKYLDETNQHLQRVVDAFKHDPDFNAEVARVALGYAIPGDQRLPAPVQNPSWPKPPQPEQPPSDAMTPFIKLFAHDRIVRRATMITAAVFIVVSLAFFNPGSGDDDTLEGDAQSHGSGR